MSKSLKEERVEVNNVKSVFLGRKSCISMAGSVAGPIENQPNYNKYFEYLECPTSFTLFFSDRPNRAPAIHSWSPFRKGSWEARQ